jgi:hypothetical protein
MLRFYPAMAKKCEKVLAKGNTFVRRLVAMHFSYSDQKSVEGSAPPSTPRIAPDYTALKSITWMASRLTTR